ncbi:MAG: hypothetical protein PWP23_2614 [Candidatus Sumerlaeota bacterium]|nr:hypothetical protein [Candidatus Sumerlaeota bacterium]
MSLNLEQLCQVMCKSGADRLYMKRLAPNDNSKNQVYLGPGFEALNVIPNKGVRDVTTKGSPILRASIDLSWIDEEGKEYPAPGAQLILYPQYPEVRMSGFLRGCSKPPSSIMTSRNIGRVILFGISSVGKVLAWAGEAGHPVTKELLGLSGLRQVGVFEEVPLRAIDSQSILIEELTRIHNKGWIRSKRLRPDGTLAACKAPNCGGYTLEAELGISPNGYSEPDFLGWEVKQHGVSNFASPYSGSPITLMTPEPTGGVYQEEGAEAFVRRFGYSDMRGRPDRMNFGGTFRAGKRAPLTGLTLVLDGYNSDTQKIDDPSRGITLIADNDEVAAVWHYSGLISHWQRKHERAVYVPSETRTTPEREYRYGSPVLLCVGTDFLRFLKAMASGIVFYDPGIKLENATSQRPKLKRRNQFRIKRKQLPVLYALSTDMALT